MDVKFAAFIDSYSEITILLDRTIDSDKKVFHLVDRGIKYDLEIVGAHDEFSFIKYRVKFLPFIELNRDYEVCDEMGNHAPLRSGSIVRTVEFENMFRYVGPLGCEYHHERSFFRIWSPVAKEIEVELVSGKQIARVPLSYVEKGLWEAEIMGDLEGYKYIYYVRVNESFVRINDPFALSSSANGKYNFVVDRNKFYKMHNKKPKFSGKYTDAIIYEASVRDFTCMRDDDQKGTYLGMIDNHVDSNGETRGLDYIKSLGITHLQLMPTYDFGDVDDLNKDFKYNWGYNPNQYFVPSGWYSKDPESPYLRINELLKLIDEIHGRGMRVNMDVVFNHVFDVVKFPFENLVPGYFFRVEMDGSLNNASGCGNVMASERFMASRFITDVLVYYARVYGVDGFRFDLMGLLDIGTLNHARKKLMAIDDKIMLYGEGWNMANPLPDELRPHMYNHKMVPGYAFFNDRYRDTLKGSQWNKSAGYCFGEEKSIYDLSSLFMGSCLECFKFDEPDQSINYVECHDNYTFYDYGKYVLELDDEKIYYATRLALGYVIFSIGVPFIHAGEEFMRTKMGIENSYSSKDAINKFDYSRRNKYKKLVDTLRDMISIRHEYEVFRMDDHKMIERKIHRLDGLAHKNSIGILLEDKDFNIIAYIKNDYSESEVDLHGYKLIFDGSRRCDIEGESFKFDKPGIYLLKREMKKWNLLQR